MRRLLSLLRLKVRVLAFGAIFLVALYVIVARSLLALVPEYREQLEQELSLSLAQPVSIGVLEGQWIGFDPVIVLKDVSLNNPELGEIREVRVRLALLRSILARDLRLRSVQIDRPEFSLEHFVDKGWHFGGFALGQGAGPSSDLSPDFLQYFDGAHVVLSDTRLDVIDSQQRRSTWRLPDLSADYKGDALHASGRLLEPNGIKPLLSFRMQGEWDLELGFIAQIYAEFRSGSDLAAIFESYEWAGIKLQQVDASGRLWLDFAAGKVQSWHTSLQISELQWLRSSESMPPIRNLAADAHWQAGEETSALYFSDMAFDWLSLDCGPMSGRAVLNDGETDVYLSQLHLACASQLITFLDVGSPNLIERLEVSEPEGVLRDLRFLSGENGWQFNAGLEAVTLKAYESTPAGKNINGYLFADAEGGKVIFDSEDFELAFPELFLEPWQSKRGQGAVNWRIQDDEIVVFSDGIRLFMRDDALVYGDFALRLNGAEHEDYLALQIALQDIDFKDVPAYVPYYAVGSDLHDWLRRALVKGKARSGIYVGYGAVESDSPPNSFTSSIQVNTKQGVLDFAEDWPNLEELDAEIFIQNGRLDISADKARIRQTPITNIRAEKPDVESDEIASILTIKAGASLLPKHLDYWLKESPIAPNTQEIAEQIRIDSALQAQLTIEVPMQGDEDVGFQVAARLKNNTVTHVPTDLTFEKVNGVFNVSSGSGVEARQIEAILLDEPVRVSIETGFEGISVAESYELFKPTVYIDNKVSDTIIRADTRSTTRVSMEGRFKLDALPQYFDIAKPVGLYGSVPFRGTLHLPSENERSPFIELSSNAQGLVRDWPAPLAKQSDDLESWRVKADIGEDAITVDANIAGSPYGQAGARLNFKAGDFVGGHVHISHREAPVFPESAAGGLSLKAAVREAELGMWLNFIERWGTVGNQTSEQMIQAMSLEVDRLEAIGRVFRQQKADVRLQNNGWRVRLSGPDATGQINIPDDGESMTLDFEVLALNASAAQASLSPGTIDPRTLPALRFFSKKLVHNEKTFGALSFDLATNDEGAVFRDLDWRLLGNEAKGQLSWKQGENNTSSILTLNLKGEDIDKLARHLEWKSPITSGNFKGALAWVWPAAPQDFSLGGISGSLEVEMEDGRLKTADEKTGALRLFGIFNAEALGRRLKLDFSDLYKSGVSYDEFTLKAKIDQGKLRIDDKLRISGPSSKYTITGMTDLGQETLDMQMLVELPVSQNVPLAALLLGAPQIGGAVWLLDKLLGEPLSQITTARYSIKGPWSDPVLELRQVLNADK